MRAQTPSAHTAPTALTANACLNPPPPTPPPHGPYPHPRTDPIAPLTTGLQCVPKPPSAHTAPTALTAYTPTLLPSLHSHRKFLYRPSMRAQTPSAHTAPPSSPPAPPHPHGPTHTPAPFPSLHSPGKFYAGI